MKKSFGYLIVLLVLFSMSLSLAEGKCDLEVSLLNQDPIPAIPGEKLEVVFTIANIDSNECGTIEFEVLEEFPFKVAPGVDKIYTIQSGTYTKDYNTQKTIPVDYIVNEDAIDGDNPLEVRYRTTLASQVNYLSKTFDIEVEDVRTSFEVFVSDYDYTTKEVTFEILNIGEPDVEAITIELPKQEGVRVFGSNKENIGDLESNEDTSFDFRADVNTNKIELIAYYSDSVQVRRTVPLVVEFDALLFEETKETQDQNYWVWALILAIVIVAIYYIKKRKKKKK